MVEIDEKLLVTHDYQPSEESDYVYDVNVAVENLTDETMDLAYRRVMDWDVYPTVFNELVSMHTGDVPELTFASNDGFASADALAGPSDRGATGDFDKFGPKDQGSLMDFDFGDLAGESSRQLHFVYGVAPSRQEALEALQDEGAVAWTLAEPSSTEDGAAEGSPNTFFFGYVDSDRPGSGPAGVNDVAPTITGTPEVGQTLTAQPGSWTPDSGLAFSYRWMRDGTAITDATGSTYVATLADAERDLSVQVTARRAGFTPARATSAPVTIAAAPSVEVITAPAIAVRDDGPAEAGAILDFTQGEWSNSEGFTRSHEWHARYGTDNDSFVVQTGGAEYAVPGHLAGYRIFVKEVVSSGSVPMGSAQSNELLIERTPQLRPITRAVASGTPKVGETLTVAPSTWGSDQDGVALEGVEVSYVWYIGNRTVNGDSITPQAGERGQYLYLEVQATKAGFQDGYDSQYLGRVLGAQEVTTPVTVNVIRAGSSPIEPVADVDITACSTHECPGWGLTGTDGTLVLDLPVVDGEYTFYAYPRNGFNRASVSYTVVADGPNEVSISVQAPVPTPPHVEPGTGFGTREVGTDGDSIPVGYVGQPATLELTGCPGVDPATWTVTFANVDDPMTGTFTENAGVYTAQIDPFTHSGDASFTTNIPAQCGEAPTEFSIYIDPAGVVTDQFGRPINGAKVTLLKEVGGTYTAVSDGDTTVMDPSINTANPSTTLADGAFRWDVTAGFYKVELTSGSSGGTSCSTATTNPLEIPPPRLDLLLKATCGDAATPVPTVHPVVTGTRQVSQTLSVSPGVWADGIIQTSVQWLRDGASIPGATGATYTQVAGDAGKVISARVTAKRPDYRQENGTGEVVSFDSFDRTVGAGVPTTGVGGDGDGGNEAAPTATSAPRITGTAKVGSTLTADPGTWDTANVVHTYQWLRGTASITGATTSTYVATFDDLDQPVSVRVTAARAGGPEGKATSAAVTVAPGAAPVSLSPPLVTGAAEVGKTLSTTDGLWDTEGLTFAHQWRRDGEAIAGATGSTYVVTAHDRGAGLSVVVTASKPGFESGQVESGEVTVPADPVRDTRTRATLADNSIAQRQRALLRVFVKALPAAAGQATNRPSGHVMVKVDGYRVKRVTLDGASSRFKVRLHRLAVGKHRIRAVYVGDANFSRSVSQVLVLKVTKNKRPGAMRGDPRAW